MPPLAACCTRRPLRSKITADCCSCVPKSTEGAMPVSVPSSKRSTRLLVKSESVLPSGILRYARLAGILVTLAEGTKKPTSPWPLRPRVR